jgi:hypothetical protein
MYHRPLEELLDCDPVARACNGPAPVRRGRSRHRCRVSLSTVGAWLPCSQGRVRLKPTSAHGSTLGLSGQSGLALPGQLDHPVRSSHRTIRSQMCGRIAPARITQSEPSLVHDEGCVRDYCQCVGHHAIDGRSVLGTGKALRVASTAHPARPSGLDGACAQLADWQLRDGRQSEATEVGTCLPNGGAVQCAPDLSHGP